MGSQANIRIVLEGVRGKKRCKTTHFEGTNLSNTILVLNEYFLSRIERALSTMASRGIHSHNYRQRLTRSTDSKRSEVCLTNQEPTNQPTNHRRSSDFAAGGIKDKEREREKRGEERALLLLLLVVVRQERAAAALGSLARVFRFQEPRATCCTPPNVGRKELAHARA